MQGELFLFCTGQNFSSWGLRIFKPWFLTFGKELGHLNLAHSLRETLCGKEKDVKK